MKDFLAYTDYLSILIFRIIFIFSFVGKLLYPYTFNSYIISIFKYHEITFLFDFIGIDLSLFIILSLILMAEAFLLYYSFTDKYIFFYGTMAFFFSTTLIVLYGYLVGINGDCGCYGLIFSFDNNETHLVLNILFLMMSLLAIVSRRKTELDKQISIH